MYRCEATSVEGFVQQLAVSYLAHGYWFYVVGQVPEGKDSRKVAEKLVARYQIDLSKWARARRKRVGLASLQYLRFGRFFVLLATHGTHAFFEEEAPSIRDARQKMQHGKIGIIRDAEGDAIVFQGSANETAHALLPDFNFESINVFQCWREDRSAGKTSATIYDFLVRLPLPEGKASQTERNLVRSELASVAEFANLARNARDAAGVLLPLLRIVMPLRGTLKPCKRGERGYNRR